MMEIETKTPAFAEHIFLNALSRDNAPEEVLRQVLKCEYDRLTLSSRFFSYDEETRRTVPMPSLPHPFATACEHGNIPVIRLFMLLGVSAHASIMERNRTPLEVFKDNPAVREVLEDDTPWLDMRFPKELAAIMEGKLEYYIKKGDFFKLFEYGLQGLRVTDTSFVFTREFQNYSPLRQAFVYRMLMSSQQRKAIADRIANVCGRKCVPPVLRRAVASDRPANEEKRSKFLASVNMLSQELVRMMADSMFSEEERISILRDITDDNDVFHTNKELWSLKEELIQPIFQHIYFC